MPETTVNHASFVITRTYPVTPEKVFAAFADPAKKSRWYAGRSTMITEEFHMDFRVGGHDRTRYRFREGTPFPGAVLTNHTCYQDIQPNRRIVFAYTMSMGDNLFSASLDTIELLPAGDETTLIFTEQAAFFEGADGPKMREEGWRNLLEELAKELAVLAHA